VLATGACARPAIPGLAEAIPAGLTTLTALAYRDPGQLPDGGVLVVGASATGVQLAGEIHTLEGCKRAAAAEVPVRDVALIKPDRNDPQIPWPTPPRQLDGGKYLLVLVAHAAAKAQLGEAGDEDQGVISDSAPDIHTPVLAWPGLRSAVSRHTWIPAA
jgi:hypothetical protein